MLALRRFRRHFHQTSIAKIQIEVAHGDEQNFEVAPVRMSAPGRSQALIPERFARRVIQEADRPRLSDQMLEMVGIVDCRRDG